MQDERTGERRLAGVIRANRGTITDALTELEWAADASRPDALVRGRDTVRPRAELFLDCLVAGLEGDWTRFDEFIGERTTTLLADGVITGADLNDRALMLSSLLLPHVLADGDPQPALGALFATMQSLSGRIVGEHNRRLLEESRRLDDLKTMFLRLTGHELRAPLGTIRGYASMLREGDFGPLAPGTGQAVAAIDSAAAAALAIIDRLVEVARLESGAEALRRAPHALDEIVTGALEPLRKSAAANGVHLTEEVMPGVAVVDLEETRIAIRNLVGNAIKYASEGGTIAVRARSDGADAIFEVVDRGPGIAPDEIGRIFDRYFRSQRTRGLGVAGSGLGLYITRRIAELHGGQATVESRLGVGSTFRLRLPASTQAAAAPG